MGTAEEENEESSFNILATAAIAPAPVNPKDVLTSIATKVAQVAHSQPALDGALPAGPAGPASPDTPAGVSFHARGVDEFYASASNRLQQDWDKDFLVRAFIELFPFGRGGPDEKR